MISASLTRRLALLAALSSGLWLAACNGSDGDSKGNTTVRALNLTSDVASLDLYTNETKRFSALATDAVSDSVTLEANSYSLVVKRAGESTTLKSFDNYSLSKDKHYTAVVWGREASLHVSTLPEDENTADITVENTSRLRFFNATTDTGSVDVFITPSTSDLGDATPAQGALTAGSLSAFRNMTSGTWRLRVTGAGNPNDVRLDIPSITLENKKYATLVLTAGSSGSLVHATLIGQQGTVTSLKNTKARVRVAASIANSGSVALKVGGTTVSAGLNSPSVGPYVLVDAGSVDMTAQVNGTSIATGARTFAAGVDYTVMAYGTPAAGKVVVITDDNRLPTQTTLAKLRLVNGIDGSAPMTMSLDYLPLATDLPAGGVSPFATAAAAGSARIDVTSPTASEPLFTVSATVSTTLLQAQGVYTIFLLDGKATPTGVFRRER